MRMLYYIIAILQMEKLRLQKLSDLSKTMKIIHGCSGFEMCQFG